jgi:hypothetical protein
LFDERRIVSLEPDVTLWTCNDVVPFGAPQERERDCADGETVPLVEPAGKDIYLVGGARTAASLIDAGLVDELRLIVYPLIAGEGKPQRLNIVAGSDFARFSRIRMGASP